jgi:hypothetical protein
MKNHLFSSDKYRKNVDKKEIYLINIKIIREHWNIRCVHILGLTVPIMSDIALSF